MSLFVLFFIFFFKQKTAYVLRISDWVQTCALPISRTASKRLQARVPTRASEPQGPCPLRLPEVPGLRHLRSSNQWFLRQFSVSENEDRKSTRLNSSH